MQVGRAVAPGMGSLQGRFYARKVMTPAAMRAKAQDLHSVAEGSLLITVSFLKFPPCALTAPKSTKSAPPLERKCTSPSSFFEEAVPEMDVILAPRYCASTEKVAIVGNLCLNSL